MKVIFLFACAFASIALIEGAIYHRPARALGGSSSSASAQSESFSNGFGRGGSSSSANAQSSSSGGGFGGAGTNSAASANAGSEAGDGFRQLGTTGGFNRPGVIGGFNQFGSIGRRPLVH